MKQFDIRIGHAYEVRVSSNLVPIRIDRIKQTYTLGSRAKPRARFEGTNLATGRSITLTAARARRPLVLDPDTGRYRPAPQYCDICGLTKSHSTTHHEARAARSQSPNIAIPYAHIWAHKIDHENYDGHGGTRLPGEGEPSRNVKACLYCRASLQMTVSSL